MKRIPESKVARWPQSITKLALLYACCFVLATMISFGVCYAYFSAKVEATGTITVGKLEIQYVDGSSATLSTLQTTITRSGYTILDEDAEDETDLIIPANYEIVPGDTINILGNVKNTGSIDAYVILQAEFILMSEDGTSEEKTFDSKFYNLNGELVTYDGTNKIYTTLATPLAINESLSLVSEVEGEVLSKISYTVNTGLTSEYSGRTFKLRLTTHAIQSENLEEDTTYSSLALQATNMMLNATPHLITDAKIYGNSVQNRGSGKNLLDINTYTITESPTFEIVNGHIIARIDFSNRFHYKITGLDPTKQYTFSFQKSEGSSQFFYVHDSRGNWCAASSSPTTVTPKEDGTLTFVFASGDNEQWLDYDIYNLQLEFGTEATEYEPYAGKNMLPIKNDLTQTISGVTMSIENGDITLNGTASSNFQFGLYLNNGALANQTGIIGIEKTNTPLLYLDAGTYTQSLTYISGSVSGSGSNFYGLYTYKDGSTVLDQRISISAANSSKTFTIAERTEAQFFVFQFVALNNNLTFDNLKFNIQLEYGSSATAYEPYVQIPNPSNPAKIESVGEKSKNILTPLVKGVSLNFTTGAEASNSNYATTDYIAVDFNTNANYYLSGLVNGLHSCVYAYNSNKEFLGRTSGGARSYLSINSGIFTSGTAQGEGDIAYLRISQYYVSGTSTGVLADIDNAKTQLEVGTAATEYIPYEKYKVPVTVRGKNLLNIDEGQSTSFVKNDNGSYTLTKSSSSRFSATFNVNFKANTIYTISYELIESTATIGPLRIYSVDGISPIFYSSISFDTSYRTFTPTRDISAIRFYLEASEANGAYTTFKNLMIEEGETKTEFEPYIEPTTTNIYLDEPLRKVGDVADYIEIKDGVVKVVRNVYSFILSSSTSIFKYASFTSDDGTIAIKFTVGGESDTLTKANPYNKNIISSHFASLKFGELYSSKKVGVAVHSSTDGNLYMYNGEFTTLDEYLQFFDDCANSGNPIEICYVLATAITTTIELPDMYTLAGNTIYDFGTEIQPSDYYFA